MKLLNFKFLRALSILLVVSISIYYLSRYVIRILYYPTKYKDIVILEANNVGVDPYLVFAMIKKESKFDKNTVSNKGAKGLMQILDSTAKDVVKANPAIFTYTDYDIFDPAFNISIGTKYLKQLINRYNGDIPLALAAYNAGLGNVDKWKTDTTIFKDGTLVIENIPFEETKEYVTMVIKYYNGYKRGSENKKGLNL